MVGTISSCRCKECQEMCMRPCLPTPSQYRTYPEEVKKGFATSSYTNDKHEDIMVLVPRRRKIPLEGFSEIEGFMENHFAFLERCIFQTDEFLCSLHKKGLKPIEGQLVHCKQTNKESNEIHQMVLEEWQDLSINEIEGMLV